MNKKTHVLNNCTSKIYKKIQYNGYKKRKWETFETLAAVDITVLLCGSELVRAHAKSKFEWPHLVDLWLTTDQQLACAVTHMLRASSSGHI